MWLWIGIGLGAFFVVSILLGVGLAAMLGTISRGVTEMHEELFETEAWAVGPPTPRRRGRLRRRRLDEVTAHSLCELEPHP
jgi:hypothetical protein